MTLLHSRTFSTWHFHEVVWFSTIMWFLEHDGHRITQNFITCNKYVFVIYRKIQKLQIKKLKQNKTNWHHVTVIYMMSSRDHLYCHKLMSRCMNLNDDIGFRCWDTRSNMKDGVQIFTGNHGHLQLHIPLFIFLLLLMGYGLISTLHGMQSHDDIISV